MPKTTPFTLNQRFHRLVTVKDEGRGQWVVRCACGTVKTVAAYNLISGRNKSCGCLLREKSAERARERNTSHGKSRSREYRIWGGMMTRCFNENDHAYPRYGGRGITVCRRWRKFENFLADMGPAPDGHSLDRKNNDKGYFKGNCHWATKITQNNNRRNSTFLTFNRRKQTLTQWARELGIHPSTLSRRLEYGWSVAQALNTPVRGKTK